MKKAAAYLVLFLFLVNTVGYYFIFEIYKQKVKREMQSRVIRSSASIRILYIADTGTDPEFQRVENKEIRYKGLLYDVVKEFRIGKSTIFHCIHDKKEEALLATMNAVNKNKYLQSLWQHLIKIACPPEDLALSYPCPAEVLFPVISVPLDTESKDTWSPPPEFA